MSYGTDIGLQAWLTMMGYSLPPGAPSAEVVRARGSAYLDATYEPLWTGQRAGGLAQADAWPRTGAKLNCVTDIASDVIPAAVVNASYRAGLLLASASTTPTAPASARVKRQKVDVIEREFFDDGAASAGAGAAAFVDPEIDGAMRQFICETSGAGWFFESIGS